MNQCPCGVPALHSAWVYYTHSSSDVESTSEDSQLDFSRFNRLKDKLLAMALLPLVADSQFAVGTGTCVGIAGLLSFLLFNHWK